MREFARGIVTFIVRSIMIFAVGVVYTVFCVFISLYTVIDDARKRRREK